jgi:hypothetical protein
VENGILDRMNRMGKIILLFAGNQKHITKGNKGNEAVFCVD